MNMQTKPNHVPAQTLALADCLQSYAPAIESVLWNSGIIHTIKADGLRVDRVWYDSLNRLALRHNIVIAWVNDIHFEGIQTVVDRFTDDELLEALHVPTLHHCDFDPSTWGD